jgi:nickel/cobalt transporter (NicO) family protein
MFATEILTLIRDGQRIFNEQILSHLESIKQEHALVAYGGLILIGFLYGALHAVGPGHGKVVVSSYMLANENSLKRGLLVVVLSSLLQAVTAIALVVGFYSILHVTKGEAERLSSLLESGSTTLIGIIGLWLMLQGLLAFKKIFLPHHHAHHHDGACCGHSHAPEPQQLESKRDIASLAAMVVSIGIRPCTGALLLLFFSCALDLALPGILATLAMAAGTALTTGALAVLTVKSKELALRFVKKSDRSLALAHAGLRFFGGLTIVLLAVFFLAAGVGSENGASLSAPQHPLFRPPR